MELIWKVWKFTTNNMLVSAITRYNVLHVFRQGRGMGTAIMEANLDQNIAGLCHEPL